MSESQAWTAVFVSLVFVELPLGAAYVYVYFLHVVPTLYRHGEPSMYAWFSKRETERQVAAYGRVCREQGYSLTKYRYLVVGRRVMLWLSVPILLAWAMGFWAQMRGK